MHISYFQEKSLQSAKKSSNGTATRDANEGTKDHSLLVYSSLLRNEILGAQIEDFKELSNAQDDRMKHGHVSGQPSTSNAPFSPTPAEQRNLFTFKARKLNVIN